MKKLSPIVALFTSILLLTGCSNSDSGTADSDTNNSDTDNSDDSASDIDQASDASIENIVWSLEEYTANTGNQAAVIEGMFYQFLADSETGELDAVYVCNGGSGDYQLGDATITFTWSGFTEIACEETSESARALESSTVGDLLFSYQEGNNTKMYSVETGTLTLSLTDGRFMVFEQVDSFHTDF